MQVNLHFDSPRDWSKNILLGGENPAINENILKSLVVE